jgi:hypothetical protein
MAYDLTLAWVAASDATASTTYAITSDETTSGTFATVTTYSATTNAGGSLYTPDSTTLNGALTASVTTVVLTDGANFSEDDYVRIDGEVIQLGTKSTHTFSACTRGVGASPPVSHSNGATVYRAHEEYTDTAVDFGSRYAIRYRITANDGTNDAVPEEIVAVVPGDPPDDSLTTVWGLVHYTNGTPKSGVAVSVVPATTGVYRPSSSEVWSVSSQSASTDSDGYWQLYLPRDAELSSADSFTLNVGESGVEDSATVTSVPDQASICYLELS